MGLEGLSIGALAEVTQMSKSGVFAHFGSREELQISVVREYHARFEEEVFFPAMREPRGLPRLRALFERWVRRVSVEIDSGCIYISGAVEFDDRPGPVRDALVDMVQAWQRRWSARSAWPSKKAICAPTPTPQQMLFEIHGLILALHHDARFLRRPARCDRARAGLRAHARALRRGAAGAAAPRRAQARRRRSTLPISPQELSPCPTTPRRCATCSSCCTNCSSVVDELKPLPRARRHRRRHHQRGARRGRQVRRRGAGAAQPERRRRGLHARQGHARGAARPPASRRPMRSTSKAAGRR